MPDSNGPEQVTVSLASLLAAGDVDAVLEFYEEDAVFVDLDTTVRGIDAIRTAHQDFVDAGLTLHLKQSMVFEAGDMALVHWAWTVTDANGSSTDGVSAEVLRRQPDGGWRFVIDNSDGSALLEQATP